jgi:hypothetical protein
MEKILQILVMSLSRHQPGLSLNPWTLVAAQSPLTLHVLALQWPPPSLISSLSSPLHSLVHYNISLLLSLWFRPVIVPLRRPKTQEGIIAPSSLSKAAALKPDSRRPITPPIPNSQAVSRTGKQSHNDQALSPLFTRLPAELRIAIWKLCLQDTVHLTWVGGHMLGECCTHPTPKGCPSTEKCDVFKSRNWSPGTVKEYPACPSNARERSHLSCRAGSCKYLVTFSFKTRCQTNIIQIQRGDRLTLLVTNI